MDERSTTLCSYLVWVCGEWVVYGFKQFGGGSQILKQRMNAVRAYESANICCSRTKLGGCCRGSVFQAKEGLSQTFFCLPTPRFGFESQQEKKCEKSTRVSSLHDTFTSEPKYPTPPPPPTKDRVQSMSNPPYLSRFPNAKA